MARFGFGNRKASNKAGSEKNSGGRERKGWAIAETFFLAAAGAIAIVSVATRNALYVAPPLLAAAVVNRHVRRRDRRELQQKLQDASERYDRLRAEIARMPEFKLTTGESEDGDRLETIVAAIKAMRQQQKKLESVTLAVRAQIDLLSEQFQKRPELEQIETLTSVIVDLQQFVNQLPQWGALQQKQLLELQQKVESAIEHIPDRVADAMHQELPSDEQSEY